MTKFDTFAKQFIKEGTPDYLNPDKFDRQAHHNQPGMHGDALRRDLLGLGSRVSHSSTPDKQTSAVKRELDDKTNKITYPNGSLAFEPGPDVARIVVYPNGKIVAYDKSLRKSTVWIDSQQ